MLGWLMPAGAQAVFSTVPLHAQGKAKTLCLVHPVPEAVIEAGLLPTR